MKQIFFLLGVLFFLSGCSESSSSQTKEMTSSEINQMTEAEREAEIAKIFSRIDVELPGNWKDMTKQERGKFILKYGLGVDMESVPVQ